jgi:hypothetical protein
MLTNRREEQASVSCFHHRHHHRHYHYCRRRSRSTTCMDVIGRHGPSRRQGGRFDRVVSLDGNTVIDASKADLPLLLLMPINSLAGAACFWLLQQKLLQLAMTSLSAPLSLLHLMRIAVAAPFVLIVVAVACRKWPWSSAMDRRQELLHSSLHQGQRRMLRHS